MTTRRLRLESKHKEHPIQVVRPEHFVWTDGEPIEPTAVVTNPDLTLYCFDPENSAVLFVETPAGVALTEHPFYYMAQFEQAIGLVGMPMGAFAATAADIPLPEGSLVLIHSVGRCGSTLLSKALAAIPSVESISEPDDLTQLGGYRAERGDAWLQDMAEAATRWRCKPRRGTPARHIAIKYRAEVMVIADLLCAAFPTAKNLFLYRDGRSWAQSIYAGAKPEARFDDADANRQMQDTWAKMMPLVAEYRRDDPPLNPIETRILAWIECMEVYLGLQERGVDVRAARYEDLVDHPRAMLGALFEFCEIGVDDWAAVDATFERDSQAGTVFGREERVKNGRGPMPDWLLQSAVEMIGRRPRLKTPDVVVPQTVTPDPPDGHLTHLKQ